jgi:hypothetical protein
VSKKDGNNQKRQKPTQKDPKSKRVSMSISHRHSIAEQFNKDETFIFISF